MNIASLDLNLLRVFDALMVERSVTRAGERIGLSQPAVSAALNRLRHLVGDQLFVREGNAMVPTPRALALGIAVREALDRIDQVFSDHSTFDPSIARRTFRLLGSDYFSTMLMPDLSRRVLAEAPNVLLQFLDGGPRAMPHVLSEGTIDLTLAPPVDIPEWAAFQFLFKSRLVVAAKKGQPDLAKAGIKAGEAVPLDLFCSLPQVICSTDGGLSTAIDSALHARGRKRRIVLTMPHFHALALAVAGGHVMGSMPSQFAAITAESLGLDLFELPVGGDELDMGMYWHRRYDGDGAHRWLREKVRTVLEA
ncbi:LysR family transcriptional regulator [Aquibium carbonis]|uniref:LysR family transcriptional regulator n=1 Tax=Aquibium carbonis TaxID=2495581 RepID=A0A3S0A2S3_9HYPH|nr:LysR family transcriptional regulator [Aquibium carbonis]RST87527.1 LysR family transcriptional regulator [Aquibium carbonis]